MNNSNHDFSFVGGDMLAKMGAWWFVSYLYYLHIDKNNLSWCKSKSASSRQSVFEASREFHVYWLTEVLEMERLDYQKNAGNVSGCETKRMAKELLAVLSNDNGATEMQNIINQLKAKLEIVR